MSFGIPVRNGLSVGLLASTFLTSGSGRLVPRLTLNFLTGAPLDSRITFSRTTNATLVDSTGRVTYAPNNLVLYSEQFDNAAWTRSFVSVTANATTSPDGTTTADRLTADGTNNTHTASQNVTYTAAAHILSVYAKRDTNDFVQLRFGAAAIAGGTGFANFDLNAGTVGTIGAGLSSASITPAGGGWYRCTITGTTLAAASNAAFYVVTSATASSAQTNTLTTSVFLWGAQLEQVTYQTLPSTYVQTVASAYYGPRFDYNPATLAARGLLIEEQRVNLALYSDQFDNVLWIKSNTTVTANAATSPDGTTTADKLLDSITNTTHAVNQVAVAAAVAGVTYTFSVFIKAAERGFAFVGIVGGALNTPFVSIDLTTGSVAAVNGTVVSSSSTAFGNGWWRVTITATTIAIGNVTPEIRVSADGLWANRVYVGNGTGIFVWGAQLEAGSFATSYIPTVASTVTRAADNATMTGTNFSSWYNASEGTIVFSGDSSRGGTPGSARNFQFDDGTSANNIRAAGASVLQVVDATVVQASLGPTPLIPYDGTAYKFASAYKLNDFASVTTGAVATDTSGTVPTAINQLALGSGSGTNYLNGHIRTFTFYPSRLTNAQMQALTS